jgi:hypothetical protein
MRMVIQLYVASTTISGLSYNFCLNCDYIYLVLSSPSQTNKQLYYFIQLTEQKGVYDDQV